MYKALYREYRPEVFSEMLGQEHIVRILSNQIRTDSTSHAYLFCGTRGTGKTTTARLLAKGLNCTSEGEKPCGVCDACRAIKEGTYLDVVEIDAASNNGVDNIRELRESVKYPPAAGRKKVYIIDEVHMLSTGAFNALLKTLEEPPEYVTFILATTDPGKLPATILSRCMRLDFKRVPEKTLIRGMADICARKGIDVSEEALRIIAANADGSVRDGLSILDQCIAGGQVQIDADSVLEFLGISGEETFIRMTEFVRKGKTAEALLLLSEVLEDGKDVIQFTQGWLNHYRNLLMTRFIKDPQDLINMSAENIDRIRRQSDALELSEINEALEELSRTHNESKRSSQPRILLEIAIVKLSSGRSEQGPEAMIKRRPAAPKQEVLRETPAQKEEPAAKEEPAEVLQEEPRADEAVQQEEEPAPEVTGYDLEGVWRAVFDDVEAGKGSFYVLATDGSLTDISESSFDLLVSREYQEKMAENNRDLIERLVAAHTDGRKRHMRVRTAGGSASGSTDHRKEAARKAEEILGIKVEI